MYIEIKREIYSSVESLVSLCINPSLYTTSLQIGGCHGRMIVGFTTTYAISAYHH